MNDAAYERWLSSFVVVGSEAYTREEWEERQQVAKVKAKRYRERVARKEKS